MRGSRPTTSTEKYHCHLSPSRFTKCHARFCFRPCLQRSSGSFHVVLVYLTLVFTAINIVNCHQSGHLALASPSADGFVWQEDPAKKIGTAAIVAENLAGHGRKTGQIQGGMGPFHLWTSQRGPGDRRHWVDLVKFLCANIYDVIGFGWVLLKGKSHTPPSSMDQCGLAGWRGWFGWGFSALWRSHQFAPASWQDRSLLIASLLDHLQHSISMV